MDEETQMMMALGDAETVDPVSGNDVPPGSMPEEVRDDIDARLSEGEYVVPADVVRFFGVRVFEEMRKEAKMGLAQMDADGRIGGQPSAEQPMGNTGISDEEVAQLEQMLSAQGMANGGLAKGGMLDKLINAATTDPMVNSRLKAAGMPVKMAVGGVVGQQIPTQSLYSDPKKVDNVIAKVATAAQQNPDLMRLLGERGITVPTVTATQTPDQMSLANSPKQTTNPVMKDAKASSVSANAGLLAYPNMPNTTGFIPSSGGAMAALAPYAMGPGVSTVLNAAGANAPAPIIRPLPITEPAPAPTTPNCGPGRYWDGVQCVTAQTDDNDSGPVVPTEITHWYDDVDLSEPVDYIDSTIAGSKEDKGVLGNIIGMTGIGKMMGTVDVLTNVARMNASVQLSVASNQMTQKEADKQIEKINGYAADNGLKQGLVDALASGKRFLAKNKRDADKAGDGDGEATPTEIATWMSNNGAGAGKNKPTTTTTPTTTPTPTPEVKPKNPTSAQVQHNNPNRGDGGETDYSGRKSGNRSRDTVGSSKTTGQQEGKTTAEKTAAGEEATKNVASSGSGAGGTTSGGADLDQAYGISGLNKGGLLGKPKKKIKAYKKGGLMKR